MRTWKFEVKRSALRIGFWAVCSSPYAIAFAEERGSLPSAVVEAFSSLMEKNVDSFRVIDDGGVLTINESTTDG